MKTTLILLTLFLATVVARSPQGSTDNTGTCGPKTKVGVDASAEIGGKGKDSIIGADIKTGLDKAGLDAQAKIKAGKAGLDAAIKAGVDPASGIKGKVKSDINAGGIGAAIGVDVGVGGKGKN